MKSSDVFVKESRFNYIRLVDGATRLIVYNCLNITGLEQVVHRGSKVVVEVPDGCMIVFTNHTIHVGVKSYEKNGGYIHLIFVCLLILSKNIIFKQKILLPKR